MKKIDLDPDSAQEHFQSLQEKTPLEPGDIPAMIIAGLIVMLPVLIFLSALLCFLLWLVSGRG